MSPIALGLGVGFGAILVTIVVSCVLGRWCSKTLFLEEMKARKPKENIEMHNI
jgi:hypothetical protein